MDIGQCDKSVKEMHTNKTPTEKMWTKKSLPEPSRLPQSDQQLMPNGFGRQ